MRRRISMTEYCHKYREEEEEVDFCQRNDRLGDQRDSTVTVCGRGDGVGRGHTLS